MATSGIIGILQSGGLKVASLGWNDQRIAPHSKEVDRIAKDENRF